MQCDYVGGSRLKKWKPGGEAASLFTIVAAQGGTNELDRVTDGMGNGAGIRSREHAEAAVNGSSK